MRHPVNRNGGRSRWSLPCITLHLLGLMFGCAPRGPEPFTFVQMCDPQLGMGGYEHDVDTFRQAVRQVNALAPDFVVICGDLVNSPGEKSFADFNRIRSGFTVPCYCAAGNHDVGGPVARHATSLAYYRKVIGRDYFSFEHKGYTFVVVNTQLWKLPSLRDETEKQDSWLAGALRASRDKKSPVFIVAHHPLFLAEPHEKDQYYNLPMAVRKRLWDTFKSSGVVAYLAGHRHRTIIQECEGILMVAGESTSRNFDKRPLGFRLWRVSGASITHEFVPLKPRTATMKTHRKESTRTRPTM